MTFRASVRPPESLPPRRPDRLTHTVELELVTPLLGGGTRTRTLDDVDFVRAPSIRGHLRFWWRALEREARTADELAAKERALWGGVADEGDRSSGGGRSLVEVRVEVLGLTAPDTSNVEPYARFDRQTRREVPETRGAYALFPAREERARDGSVKQPAAPRRPPGTQFRLSVACPIERSSEVRAAINAWILFGGLGGRYRRGLGSLSVVGPSAADWLPADPCDAEEIGRLLGGHVFLPTSSLDAHDRPRLASSAMFVSGHAHKEAVSAWVEALHWLRDFRQSPKVGARDPGTSSDPKRPGCSNWPEADKLRRLASSASGRTWAHSPRHNEMPAWPRAGFGLPIVGQFQRRGPGPKESAAYYDEPDDFEFTWRTPGKKGKPQCRLASPLVVKPLALADGRFLALALWFDRAYPRGEVFACWRPKGRQPERVPDSTAPFDVLVAPGDQARFAPLADGQTAPPGRRLRRAFLGWLENEHGARRVVGDL